MKVLFFSYAYPSPVQAGLGTFNRSMIQGLTAEHDVRVVSPVSFVEVWKARLRGRLPNGLNDPAFTALPGVPAEYVTYYYSPKVLRNHYGRCMWWSVNRRLNQTMRTFRPDVVLSYWTHPDSEVAVRMAHRHGVPAVVMVGGSDVLLLGRSGGRRRKILDVLHQADAVVTVSDHIATTLAKDEIDRTKLHVVRRGVDRVMFSPGNQLVARRGLGQREECQLIVAAGRLVPVKGFQHLIQACRLLADRGITFGCRIIGEGPLREELQKQIVRLGLKDRVHLVGSQSQSQLAEWYRAANLVALPSLSEGVPNVLLEAIACDTPFVASNVGGIPEIADEQHDRLVPPSNPEALADAIERQLKLRRDGLPPRSFEPLALRSAARCLSQVMELACQRSSAGSASSAETGVPAQSFTPPAMSWSDAGFGATTDDEDELEEVPELEATTFDPRDFRRFACETSSADRGICRPANGSLADELGRTAEEFVLVKK